MTVFQGHLVDSCDKLIQDLNNELNWLSDTEQLLRDDQPISDEAYKVESQLEAQRVCLYKRYSTGVRNVLIVLSLKVRRYHKCTSGITCCRKNGEFSFHNAKWYLSFLVVHYVR